MLSQIIFSKQFFQLHICRLLKLHLTERDRNKTTSHFWSGKHTVTQCIVELLTNRNISWTTWIGIFKCAFYKDSTYFSFAGKQSQASFCTNDQIVTPKTKSPCALLDVSPIELSSAAEKRRIIEGSPLRAEQLRSNTH